MAVTSDLKPCPFCGGEADVMLSQSRWGQSYTIHHDALGKCPAEYVGSMQFATEAEAIAAWNTRAERTCEPPYDELLRCLENDWNISASWDGLRRFWHIGLTEEGVRLRDAELNSRAERTCRWEYPQGVNGWIGYTVCSSCGEKYDECVTDTAHYCPNCGAKVVGE